MLIDLCKALTTGGGGPAYCNALRSLRVPDAPNWRLTPMARWTLVVKTTHCDV